MEKDSSKNIQVYENTRAIEYNINIRIKSLSEHPSVLRILSYTLLAPARFIYFWLCLHILVYSFFMFYIGIRLDRYTRYQHIHTTTKHCYKNIYIEKLIWHAYIIHSNVYWTFWAYAQLLKRNIIKMFKRQYMLYTNNKPNIHATILLCFGLMTMSMCLYIHLLWRIFFLNWFNNLIRHLICCIINT